MYMNRKVSFPRALRWGETRPTGPRLHALGLIRLPGKKAKQKASKAATEQLVCRRSPAKVSRRRQRHDLSVTMDVRIFAVLIVFAIVVAAAKDVTLQKCCKMDEYLNKETNYTCVKSNSERNWSVKIFDPVLSTFLDSIPEGWLFEEDSRPRCSKPMQYSSVSSMVNYIVAVNGSVFVPSLNSSFFPPQEYCLDYEAILVCTPELMAPKVRKCCSDGFVYTHLKNTCVKATDIYKVSLKKEFAHVDSFPECESEGNISLAIVGTMKDSELFENGSILVQKSGLLLEAETFCLVNVLESPGKYRFHFTTTNTRISLLVLVVSN